MSTRTMLLENIPDVTFKKMQKQKEEQGYADKTWAEWFKYLTKDIFLNDSPSEQIQKHTKDGLLEIWVQNLARNLPKIWEGRSIADIVPQQVLDWEKNGEDTDRATGTAIVIGRGPSLFEKRHLEMLAKSDYRGTIIATDGALIECLKRGIDPTNYENFYSITVDGNRELITKWYDNDLVKQHGKNVKAILCSSVAPNVVEACEKNGVEVFWFHPLFDDYRQVESYTKIEQFATKCEKHKNGLPAMQAGGHAGATAWVLSWVVLRKSPVALIGLNLGYTPETPLEKTYYWDSLKQATGGNSMFMSQAYQTIHNPDYNVDAIVDPVFAHYREAFRDLAASTPSWVSTVNCTEGGSLFGERIKCTTFQEFLEKHKR